MLVAPRGSRPGPVSAVPSPAAATVIGSSTSASWSKRAMPIWSLSCIRLCSTPTALLSSWLLVSPLLATSAMLPERSSTSTTELSLVTMLLATSSTWKVPTVNGSFGLAA